MGLTPSEMFLQTFNRLHNRNNTKQKSVTYLCKYYSYELYEEVYKTFSHETKLSTVDKTRKKDEIADRKNIKRLRIISIDRYKDKSHFLSITRDGMFLTGVVNSCTT